MSLINGLREKAHHQLSRLLVSKYAVLAIESLNVAGMDKLPHQAKAIRDTVISGLLQKIRYKADWYVPSWWKRTASIRPASSAPTAALTMRVWGGNRTGPAHSAAYAMTATKMPRSIC